MPYPCPASTTHLTPTQPISEARGPRSFYLRPLLPLRHLSERRTAPLPSTHPWPGPGGGGQSHLHRALVLMLKPTREVSWPHFTDGEIMRAMGMGALTELERHPAWVCQHLDPRCSLPLSHTHSHFLPFSHTCTRILTIHKTLHNTQGFYTLMHTGTFSHSCIHSHSNTRAHTFTHTHLYRLTHMHPHMHLTHTHSYAHIATLIHTLSQHTHFHSLHLRCLTHVYSETCPYMHSHMLIRALTPTSLLSRITHTHAQESWKPPKGKIHPHLPQCPCRAVTVALECWRLNSGG